MNQQHQDNEVELILSVRKDRIDGTHDKRTTVKDEWSPELFRKKYRQYFRQTRFFPVSELEYRTAAQTIDLWIEDFYKGKDEILIPYRSETGTIPPNINNEFPKESKLYKDAWNILTMINQNKWCHYQVLERQIPEFPNLNISLWSGYKVLGPFTCEMNIYYNVIKLKGKLADIDSLMKEYRK